MQVSDVRLHTHTVTVDEVLVTPTWKRGVTRYDVNCHVVYQDGGPGLGLTYETIDPLLASLCERAQKTQQPVTLTWRYSPYGKQIVKAELARQEVS